jgi:hypothetical protein
MSARAARIAIMTTLAATATLATRAPGGPVWDEISDAGATAPKSETTSGGNKELTRIRGNLSATGFVGADFEDMYLIRICDPDAFKATTLASAGGIAEFNSQLFIFKPDPPVQAFGLLGNDDAVLGEPDALLTGVSDDGSGAKIEDPGLYYIAISVSGWDPGSAGGAIFVTDLADEISGPDGPGGPFAHTLWAGDPGPIFGDGRYTIDLDAVTFADVPLLDCNCNGIIDACDLTLGLSKDADNDGIPDECACLLDLDRSGSVGFADLSMLLAQWGPCPGCPGDVNCNNVLGFADLAAMLAAWGPC